MTGMDALTVLRSVFGHQVFRPLQGAVIRHVIEGHSALVLMPTGGGKSLCYQVPSLVREGTGVIISPLIALMHEQVSALQQAGVSAACLNSDMNPAEQRRVERDFAQGTLDMLYVAPERLFQPRTAALLAETQIALFAIDEAHCVSQWGHDFRPEYLQLHQVMQHFPGVPRLALTATADEMSRREIASRLAIDPDHLFVGGFDRPNITYAIGERTDARRQLLQFVRSRHDGDAGIVYCLRRADVDNVAAWLRKQGLDAVAYHAGLDSAERHASQQRFINEEGVIVVATIAFGMGIDKPNVRFVVHLGLPKSLEAYYQETGRAGRDGLPADAWMIYNISDVVALRNLIRSGSAPAERKRVELQKFEALLALCEARVCRRKVLLEYFGDQYAGPCGRCDRCMDPPEVWDGTEAARKALSCIYRLRQRFGAAHVVDVLRGAATRKIRSFGHDTLSTYGIGRELSPAQWRSVLRQLLAMGVIDTDEEGLGILRLTPRARPILRGEETVELCRVGSRAARTLSQPSADVIGDEDADPKLFAYLRQQRLAIARESNLPPYVIFHDTTLKAMAARPPRDLAEFAQLPGVGDRKLEKYGARFLALIDRYRQSAA